ncbi:type II toxin-antitoxin system Phd/YefM family antitoxin [Azospirillum thermophilum]|uniref:Type II toxin-antitoxin system prevent-host-death family antitoxin n=1 Tax=Azospirillum thermophilum TaxID=2202148 RepID=A0A2S2CQQ7_9PROT|nr:type II toxin-antitoxin system prevent-host-death family antitoxin [Azospirillum thermophilum]AWK86841.1 type II toxin-antitoxin system prevent-host-death family antitoxin [Azospirillum thermophilum]
MKMLSIEEAQGQLAKLAEEAQRGEEIVLTSQGTPVLRLVPESGPARDRKDPQAVRAFLDDLEEGMSIGERNWTRDDIYEERLKRFR